MKNFAQLRNRLVCHVGKPIQFKMFFSDIENPQFIEIQTDKCDKILSDVNSTKFNILDILHKNNVEQNNQHIYKKEFYYFEDNVNILEKDTFEIIKQFGADKIFKYQFKFLKQ